MATKTCTKCKKRLALEKFFRHMTAVGPVGQGRQSWCKACQKAAKPKAKGTRRKYKDQRERQLFYAYGVRYEQYDAMLVRQGGGCGVCRSKKPGHGWKNFCVDHDHETGKFRGVLCWGCNLLIGHSKESPETLRKAAAYLVRQQRLASAA